jgi:hypothetical protein
MEERFETGTESGNVVNGGGNGFGRDERHSD